MTERTRRAVSAASIVLGIVLLAVTIARTDLAAARLALQPVAWALPLVLLPAAIWHVLRTEAWRRCFPDTRLLSFARLFRVRLAAEAFSFVTIRGVAGEPLKVVLLGPDVPPMIAAAAVALERVAYIVITMFCVGLLSALAMTMVPMPIVWQHIFRWLCGASIAFVAISLILARRRSDDSSRSSDRPRNVVARFFHQLALQFRTLLASDHRRLLILVSLEVASFAAMVAEVWVVLALAGTSATVAGAVAIETFTRVWSRASTYDAERGRVTAWVLTMTRSQCLERLRTKRRESRDRLALEAAKGVPDVHPGPQSSALAGESAARVQGALLELPREQEELLRAAFFGGLSYSQVAEAFGQPLGTVKTRIRAALTALRRSLAPEGECA